PANGNYSKVVQYRAADGSMKAIAGDAHSISHRIGNGGMGGQCLPDVIAQIHAIDKYYGTLFASLVGQLDSFTEGDVKLLDNTATVSLQETSDENRQHPHKLH